MSTRRFAVGTPLSFTASMMLAALLFHGAINRSTLAYDAAPRAADEEEKPVVINSTDLAAAWAKDEKETEQKYNRKDMIVTGEVVKTSANEAGAALIELKGQGKTDVYCNFTAFDAQETKPIKVGQKLKVKGQYANIGDGGAGPRLIFCHLAKD